MNKADVASVIFEIILDGIFLVVLYQVCQYMFNAADSKIIKNRNREVRLAWKIIILLIAIPLLVGFTSAILSFFIPGIGRQHLILIDRPTQENLGWGKVIVSCIWAVMNMVAVFVMVIKLERRPFSLKEFGLDWKRSSALHISVGIVLGILLKSAPSLFFGYDRFSNVFVTTYPLQILAVIQMTLWVMPAAFAEEILFRVYLQSRLVERMGLPLGILTTAVLFRLVHPLISHKISYVVSLYEIYGLLTWCLIGYLYYRYRSLYLVGTIHSTMNIFALLKMSGSAPP